MDTPVRLIYKQAYTSMKAGNLPRLAGPTDVPGVPTGSDTVAGIHRRRGRTSGRMNGGDFLLLRGETSVPGTSSKRGWTVNDFPPCNLAVSSEPYLEVRHLDRPGRFAR